MYGYLHFENHTMSTATAQLGKHGFNCACDPRNNSLYTTFSIGIFQWVQASNGGLKRSPAKVRVRGFASNADAVWEVARQIAAVLGIGQYVGPKNVTVK